MGNSIVLRLETSYFTTKLSDVKTTKCILVYFVFNYIKPKESY